MDLSFHWISILFFFVMGFGLLLSVVLAFMLPETINSRKKVVSESVEENERN